MLETDFIYVYGGDVQLIVPVDHETVIGFVSEVGGTVDIVHLYTAFPPIQIGTVYFSGMGHKEDDAVVLPGKAD